MDTVAEPNLVIYGLRCKCHPQDGVRYVGRTIQGAKKRLVGHRNEMNRGSRYPVHCWMRKHGPENIFYEILAVALDFDTLARLEVEFFQKLSESGNLLNIQRVYQDVFRPVHSPETRAKMSKTRMGHATSQETREKISRANRGKSYHTAVQRAASSERMKKHFGEAHFGVKLKEVQVLEIISMINQGMKNSEIARIFGVTRQAINFIRTGKNWKHLERPWGDSPPA